MFTHLKRYSRPEHFADFAQFDRNEYYVAYGQHRDSDTLARSNFRSMLEALGGESDTVIVIRDSHFLVGYVETIYIHESDVSACQTADRILAKLEGYPVVSEDDWSDLEWSEASEYWARMTVRERIEYLRDAHISVFAARRDYLPEDPQGALLEALTRS